MKRKTKKIPDSVRACLWFANLDLLDLEREREIVISSILNRGTWSAVRWLCQFYGEEKVRKTISHPKRGFWFPQSLRFWLLFFGLSLKKEVFKKALFQLAPR